MSRILAIDQGTTNTKVVLFDASLTPVARASRPTRTHYPADGWAEQSADEIWQSVRAAIGEVVAAEGAGGIEGIAISNQRETLVLWDAEGGPAPCPAILWQCRRTAGRCAELIAEGHDETVVAATGLGINPLFPASKLAWAMENVDRVAELHAAGRLRGGTVDTWLLWNLTGGAAFATDHSNASRTLLFDTAKLDWSEELASLFGAPHDVLPKPMPSDSRFGVTAESATALPAGVPILSVMGDSHAALYGHDIRAPGEVKATFGTGSSLMTLTPERTASGNGLSGTIAWSEGGRTAYALEGNITVSAQAAAYVAGLLGLPSPAALSDLAQTVPDANGVSFVPALAGLGAPHWDDAARGTIGGLTLSAGPAHIARATFEAIAHQVADVFEAMERDIGQPLAALKADGGASGNDWLMQLQADLLGRPVLRRDMAEIGARGAASMALRALGHAAKEAAGPMVRFAPLMKDAERHRHRAAWVAAVAQARARSA
ncbi:FGGY family carbohydrate kinase [Roseicyclus sp. F158]|uniref:ATP:glycerol 3-phosphotransferase n=1 Tax=Tropicimonas omnivorans TaxID=3075590 RepID=A0ABU3DJE1_9RHOB|nr:FGGY family carbohydrate kinase [Roseicyclus sp. F158]MDT0683845.1 FGGY family carbohydrate kinase [Roseicyclus sp. F158]